MPVERDATLTDRNLGQCRTYLAVEPVAIHAKVGRCVAEADEARRDHLSVRSRGFARCTVIAGAWWPGTALAKTDVGEVQGTSSRATAWASQGARRSNSIPSNCLWFDSVRPSGRAAYPCAYPGSLDNVRGRSLAQPGGIYSIPPQYFTLRHSVIGSARYASQARSVRCRGRPISIWIGDPFAQRSARPSRGATSEGSGSWKSPFRDPPIDC